PTDRSFVSCTTLHPKPFSVPPSHPLPTVPCTPRASAFLPQGKILSHPRLRSPRHSTPQERGPKGKMIEGRSGGSGRGTRRELWAPPGSGSSTSGSYVVSCTDARPSPPTHFLPSAASSPSPLPAGHREKFRRTRAHVQLGAGLFLRGEFQLDFSDDSLRDFVLEPERIAEIAFVTLGPEVGVGRTLNQLRGDADAIAFAFDRTFNHGVDIQLSCNFRNRLLHSLIPHGRGARDDSQRADLGQLGGQFFG